MMKSSSSAMDTLNRLASSLSSSVSSTVFSTVSTIKDVLPGNPVNREFEAQEHIASAGPGKICVVYSHLSLLQVRPRGDEKTILKGVQERTYRIVDLTQLGRSTTCCSSPRPRLESLQRLQEVDQTAGGHLCAGEAHPGPV